MYEGKALYINYNNLVDIGIKAGFTRSNGQTELYRSLNVMGPVKKPYFLYTWHFQEMNPWFQRYLLRKPKLIIM